MKKIPVKDVLRGIAKALVKGGAEAFVTEEYAVDSDGATVKPKAKEAVAWCALGVGYRDFGVLNTKRANKHFTQIIGQGIDDVNDGEGLDAVITSLRTAARRTTPINRDTSGW